MSLELFSFLLLSIAFMLCISQNMSAANNSLTLPWSKKQFINPSKWNVESTADDSDGPDALSKHQNLLLMCLS